jgi:PadR family transcriptional regulator AphA
LSSDPTLTPTSYIVLGLLAAAGPSTPYALKQGVAGSVGHFWSVPHSQLYAEPERLADGGYVTEDREPGGRRRRVYEITHRGREALAAWLAEGDARLPELRDLAAGHREQLELYRGLHDGLRRLGDPAGHGALLTLEAGIAHAEVWVAFWERLAAGRS